MLTHKEFYDKFKNDKLEVMRLALLGDGFTALITSMYAIDHDASASERSKILGVLRSNKMMEAYVNAMKLWQELPAGKIKADYFEAYAGYWILSESQLSAPLDYMKAYIEWAWPKIVKEIQNYPHAQIDTLTDIIFFRDYTFKK